jgi:subtilisin-like proprotein convertase family protein
MRTLRKPAVTVIALLLLSGLIAGLAWPSAGPGRADVSAQERARIAESALQQIQALVAEKEARTPAQRKLDSQLLYASKMHRGESLAAGVSTLAVNLEVDPQEKTVVDISAVIGGSLLEDLESLGATAISVFPQSHSLRALAPLDQLENLAALPGVRFIQPKQEFLTARYAGAPGRRLADGEPQFASPPFATRAARVQAALLAGLPNLAQGQERIAHVGVKNSEGDSTHRAALARSVFGSNGAGVRIGVLSDGVDNLGFSQSRGELPPDVLVLPGQYGVGDEGTAMLEIIHDLAPGAKLFFATGINGIASFADNIRKLRAAGCDIIVDDLAYLAETPFQDGQAPGVMSPTNGGVVTQAVNEVTAAGALYFSSAGNGGNKNDNQASTWEGDFVDGGTHPLLPSGQVHDFGGMTFNQITLSGGLPAFLFWSDPLGGSSNDYDLFVLNSTGTSVVASSTNIQNGTQDPVEAAGGIVTGNRLVIVKKPGAANRFLHLTIFRGLLARSTDGAIFGHPMAANAFAVAATPAANFAAPPNPAGPFPFPFHASNSVELFSSDGPRRIFFNADSTAITPGDFAATGGLLRQKPDITAADGVMTNVAGFTLFFGTSAAAPHAAAIAALLKSANPLLTPAQMWTALTNSAIDIEAPGIDRDSGAGIIMAFEALQFIGAMPRPNFETGAITATETSGNNNTLIEPGESAALQVRLRNTGAVNADSLIATLTTTTPGVTITQDTATYPALAVSSGFAVNDAPFVFRLSQDAPCPLKISFTLTISFAGAAGPKRAAFDLEAGTPPLTITSTLDSFAPVAGSGFTAATGLQTARLFRDGIPTNCTTAKTCPGPASSGTRRFDAYTFTNCSDTTSCVTVALTNSCSSSLFAAAYLGNFNPANLCANYLADSGFSTTNLSGPIFFSFNVPAGATFTVVVSEVDSGRGLGCNYILGLSGLCCQAGGNCPVINGVNPASGAVGSLVTLTGAHFTGVTGVQFAHNLPAPFGVVSDTQLLAVVPLGAANGPIRLSKPGCQDVEGSNFTVAGAVSCHTVTSIAPTVGSPGSTVKITGTNLTGVTSIKFADNLSAASTIDSDTQITATVPEGVVTGPITLSKPGCPDVQTAVFAPEVQLITAPPAVVTAESCSPANGAPDPGEIVTMSFPIKNIGGGRTTNLTATLRATGGVTAPGGPQSYGVLIGGGAAVARPFTFAVDPDLPCGAPVTATLELRDGVRDLGTLSFTFNAGAVGTEAMTKVYSYTGAPVTLPDLTTVEIPITVPDLAVADDVNVRVRLNHTFDADLDIFLVGPDGTVVELSTDNGGSGDNYGSGPNDCTGAFTVFDDAAATPVTAGSAPFLGTFRPEGALAAFNSKPINGVWKLRITDDFSSDTGVLGCWQLEITSKPFVCCSPHMACHSLCFRSAGYYLLRLGSLPSGQVLIGGVNFNIPVSTANVTEIMLALQGGWGIFNPQAHPLQTLNREFVAAQLSLLAAGGGGSPPVVSALNSLLSCSGLDFTPLRLSNGFIFTPSTPLKDLFEQTRLAIQERRTEDMLALAKLWALLNGQDLLGRCNLAT